MCLQLSNSPRQNAEGYVGQREFGWFRAKMRLVGCEIMVSKKDMWVQKESGWLRTRMRLVGCEIMLGENAFGWVRGFWVISEVRLVGWVRGHEDLWGEKKERGPHGLDAGLERSRR